MNKVYDFKFLIFLIFMMLLSSCAKEKFGAKKSEDIFSTPLTLNTTSEVCANHTLIKPQVDFLFLWDNTSSQFFITDETKQALSNTISHVSERFDYHILLAPLVPISSGEDKLYLIAASEQGLSNDALKMRVSEHDAPNILANFTTSSNSREEGIKRSLEILEDNISNGIFRKNSYTILVLMSNGDDLKYTSNGFLDGPGTSQYINSQKSKLLNINNNQLQSIKTRFISLVAHQHNCKSGWRIGSSYKKFSKMIHESFYQCDGDTGGEDEDLECKSSSPDSHDICDTSFLHLFDSVNNSIQDSVLKHKYNYWPISFQKSPLTFNPETLKVKKSNGDEYFEVESNESGSGWKFIGWQENHPTTYEPFIGEKKNAYLIELYGDAKVSYPECLIISADTPTYYYGYVALNSKPKIDSIQLKINGELIPQSSDNGWEYIGYNESLNIKIQGPNFPSDTHQEVLPAEVKSNSHFLKLNGSAIYSNGDSTQVIYDPAGI